MDSVYTNIVRRMDKWMVLLGFDCVSVVVAVVIFFVVAYEQNEIPDIRNWKNDDWIEHDRMDLYAIM